MNRLCLFTLSLIFVLLAGSCKRKSVETEERLIPEFAQSYLSSLLGDQCTICRVLHGQRDGHLQEIRTGGGNYSLPAFYELLGPYPERRN